MSIGRCFGTFLALIVLGASAAAAQQTAPAAQASPAAQSGNGRIYLDVVVSEKSGKPVPGLQQQDFTLLDNKTPQTIASFQAVTGRQAPLEVILLLDAVNAPYQSVGYERMQISDFLRSEGGNLAYPVTMAVFTDTGTDILGNFSTDGKALSAALDQKDISLRAIARSSGYYGAAERWQLSIATLRKLAAAKTPQPRNKVILWISPGWPLLSGPETELSEKQEERLFGYIVSISNELLKENVTLYSINPAGPTGSVEADWSYEQYVKGVSKPSQVMIGDLALPVIAVQSGGLAFGATNGIADRLRQCLADSAPYYEISFNPPPAKKQNEYHHLQVKLAEHGLIARTRQGYYAQP